MNEEFIKEIIKSTISGEPHLGTNLKEQCLMYFDNLISENKQLKQQLELSEKARKEGIKYVKKTSGYDNPYNDTFLNTYAVDNLLEILDIDKGE